MIVDAWWWHAVIISWWWLSSIEWLVVGSVDNNINQITAFGDQSQYVTGLIIYLIFELNIILYFDLTYHITPISLHRCCCSSRTLDTLLESFRPNSNYFKPILNPLPPKCTIPFFYLVLYSILRYPINKFYRLSICISELIYIDKSFIKDVLRLVL